jgi:hypothetical protein
MRVDVLPGGLGWPDQLRGKKRFIFFEESSRVQAP